MVSLACCRTLEYSHRQLKAKDLSVVRLKKVIFSIKKLFEQCVH